jgi:hypothetical protein
VSSKRFTFTHTTGYATWVTIVSRLHNSGADQSSPVSFSGASFSEHLFFIHIHFFFCQLSFISQSKSSLWTPNYQAYQDLFKFDGGGNRSARKKIPVRDLRRKSLLYGANYLVPRAGIEPTSRTDIGYRPVSQTRQTRCEQLGHYVPHCCFALSNLNSHIAISTYTTYFFRCKNQLSATATLYLLNCLRFRWLPYKTSYITKWHELFWENIFNTYFLTVRILC